MKEREEKEKDAGEVTQGEGDKVKEGKKGCIQMLSYNILNTLAVTRRKTKCTLFLFSVLVHAAVPFPTAWNVQCRLSLLIAELVMLH